MHCRSGILAALVLAAAAAASAGPARAQTCEATVTEPCIEWEVKNRFRLFQREADFRRHVEAHAVGAAILDVERKLAAATDGFGWAKDIVDHLCLDSVTDSLPDRCQRTYASDRTGRTGDRLRTEPYLAPTDHRVGLKVRGLDPTDLVCRWTLWDAAPPGRQFELPCTAEVIDDLAVGYTTHVSVSVRRDEEVAAFLETGVEVRDLLIAGLGDSVASGEGNPDRAVALSDRGFCFRRILGGSEFFRPGRRDYRGVRDCPAAGPVPDAVAASEKSWTRAGADWMSPACHRSLYSHQVRTALALAVEQRHVAVTFLPLACTGAQIDEGLLGSQRVREFHKLCDERRCPGSAPAQIGRLQRLLKQAEAAQPGRRLDALLLTIGANDIGFSPMVAHVLVDRNEYEYSILNQFGMMRDPKQAAAALEKGLTPDFRKLRAALRPLVGGSLARVVYVRYGHPALQAPGTPCDGGRHGVDIHPAFAVSAERLAAVADFVSRSFFPRLEALATCGPGGGCTEPERERMTYVDGHGAAFARAGFCAREPADPAVVEPEFDRQCFRTDGKSFRDDQTGLEDPMTDGCSASGFRPYTPRARWIRTPNDAYFAGMTYPYGVLQEPRSNHDGLWGLKAAVYGGAIHPTAEGHAAMADAALPALRRVVGLAPPPVIKTLPIAPPAN